MKSKFKNSTGFTPTPDGVHSKIWSSKTTSSPLVWGFTLIELLVVMAIIVVISGLSLANWRGGEKQYALLRAASKLSQDIRRAEEMAISSKEFQGQIPEGGYGVYFKDQEKDHYVLFADLNGNQHYDSGSDGLVEDVKIEKDIQISQLSASPLIITFTPPDPTVTIKPDAQTASITLSIITDPAKSKTITVNKAGLVFIGTSPSPPPPTCFENGISCSTGSECCSGYCYVDTDGDSYTGSSGAKTCKASAALSGNDCDDGNPSIYPGTSGGLTCSICQGNGTIAYQTSNQDLFNECGISGCLTGDCKGDSYACGYYTSGQHNCSSGYICNASGSCVSSCYANATSCTAGSQCCSTYCYRDADADGYAAASGAMVCKASASLGADCCDTDVNSYPGESTYYATTNACGSWDWDCNGTTNQSNCAHYTACTTSGPITCYGSPYTCNANMNPMPFYNTCSLTTPDYYDTCGGTWTNGKSCDHYAHVYCLGNCNTEVGHEYCQDRSGTCQCK